MKPEERKSKQELILAILGKCGSVKQACAVAGVERKTFYNWKENNKAFEEAVRIADEEANDTIDDEIVRRAIEGVEEPLVSMGNVIYEEIPAFDENGDEILDHYGRPKMKRGARITTHKYSDSLLLALAKSRMSKYREKQEHDHTISFAQQAQQAYDGLVVSLANEDKKQAHTE